jgi:hypothetical protein
MDTFCVLPWFGKEIRRNQQETHCCLLPNNYNLDQIKSDLLEGIQSPFCQKCWNLENQGLKSDRQVKNESLDFFWDRNLEDIKQDAANGNYQTRILKLTTSNICNATCVSCNSNDSSKWEQLRGKTSNTRLDLEKIKDQVDFKELKMLSLLGGEPLYEKKNFELFEYLISSGNDSLFLNIVTNGSVKLTSRQKHTLSQFKNLNFSVSIDGIESVFEYMRFPLRWDELNENLKFFNEITNNISSNYTLSNLNILYHNQTKAWFEENNIVYSVAPVYDPIWLQPRALSLPIKQLLKEKLSSSDYNTFIGPFHTEQDQQNFESMLVETKKQDALKKIQMADYMPELASLL